MKARESSPRRATYADLLALPDHAVAVCDDAGVITAWNDRAADLTGVPAGEALGRDLTWLSGPDRSISTELVIGVICPGWRRVVSKIRDASPPTDVGSTWPTA